MITAIIPIPIAPAFNVVLKASLPKVAPTSLENGATVKSAIDAGFNKALSAILDSNITTLIAAVVLYIMGIGSIKGFALTLGIEILHQWHS